MEKEKYLLAIKKREELEENLKIVNEFIAQFELELQTQFEEGFDPENIELDPNTFYTKNIGKKVNTDEFVGIIQDTLELNFGDKGVNIFNKAKQEATSTRTTLNKTKFEKALREASQEFMIDTKELVKAAEATASEKTINYKLEKVKGK